MLVFSQNSSVEALSPLCSYLEVGRLEDNQVYFRS